MGLQDGIAKTLNIDTTNIPKRPLKKRRWFTFLVLFTISALLTKTFYFSSPLSKRIQNSALATVKSVH